MAQAPCTAVLNWAPGGAISFEGPAELAEAVNAELSERFGCGPTLSLPSPSTPGLSYTRISEALGRRDTLASIESHGLTCSSAASSSGGMSPSAESPRTAQVALADEVAEYRGALRPAGESHGGPSLRAVVRAIEHNGCELVNSAYTRAPSGLGSGGVRYVFADPLRRSHCRPCGRAPLDQGSMHVPPPPVRAPAQGDLEWVASKWRQGLLSPRLRGRALPKAVPHTDNYFDGSEN
eukprot:TRINITY_DN16615_c0_g1_i2.p1 TRINITY_DN16615_c0_g1~~TRINITY_DN16615_c0_g1_i2.p1  ORF type:complete len:263 (+),score=62.40 TRINITY_DN16615_c0_g1_i2:83-790(+)